MYQAQQFAYDLAQPKTTRPDQVRGISVSEIKAAPADSSNDSAKREQKPAHRSAVFKSRLLLEQRVKQEAKAHTLCGSSHLKSAAQLASERASKRAPSLLLNSCRRTLRLHLADGLTVCPTVCPSVRLSACSADVRRYARQFLLLWPALKQKLNLFKL